MTLAFDFEHFYGSFHAGAFPIGSEIPGRGEVLWSYPLAARSRVYVIGGWRVRPIEGEANNVERDERMSDIPQERVFTLIEQAIKELDGAYEATPVQVQAWLLTHQVDLPIEQVSSNMKIVRDTRDGEWE